MKNENIARDPIGYKGELRERLIREKIGVWSVVKVSRGNSVYEGVVLPRSEHTAEDYLVVKVDTGYNIGVKITDECKLKEIGYQKGTYRLPEVKAKIGKDVMYRISFDDFNLYVSVTGQNPKICELLVIKIGKWS